MSAMLPTESKSPSRRALLAGAIGRPSPVRAEGENFQVGGEYTTVQSVTKLVNQGTPDTVFHVETAGTGWGLRAIAVGGFGVYGSSQCNMGVLGSSDTGYGVMATHPRGVASLATRARASECGAPAATGPECAAVPPAVLVLVVALTLLR